MVRILAVFALASAATMWCIVDSSLRGAYYLHSFRWLTMFTWPVAIPVYLVKTRQGKGALLALLLATSFCAVECGAAWLGQAWLRGS